ncbi:MAG TPA: YajQ family cyclic di-GMP-binding protein [Actinomycetota bacterium]|nr:YajQ family cyclic di-GMP-binding protein [Actinomycetota bacterium]
MAKDSSFDVVSEVDRQEVDNALNQAGKELSQRYDFKGTGTSINWQGDLEIRITSSAEQRVQAALDVFQEKCVKRGISLKALQLEPIKEAGGGTYKMDIKINQGIGEDKAKAIVKSLKQSGLKVQAAIQGEQVRVSGKTRDVLQEAIAHLKEADFGIPLQFTNYR